MGVVDAWLDGAATWSRAGDDRPDSPSLRRWALCDDEGALLTIFDSGEVDTFPLPFPSLDDAAAYRMETRELDGIERCEGGWRAWAVYPGYAGHIHPERRTAACLAVCHKYADHPELGPLCRELITRLTSKETENAG